MSLPAIHNRQQEVKGSLCLKTMVTLQQAIIKNINKLLNVMADVLTTAEKS